MTRYVNLYCDESSQTGHHYMVIGSLACEVGYVQEIIEAIRETKRLNGGMGELKWEKVKPRTLERYKAIADLACRLRIEGKIHFHCIVIDCHKLNHQRYNLGDRDIGFSKFIYQLLLKYPRIYPQDTIYYVYLDARTTSHGLEDFRRILNMGARKNYRVMPYRIVEFRDSQEFELIQLSDFFTGAVAFQKNDKHLPSASSKTAKAKAEMVEYLQDRLHMPNLCNTPMKGSFTVWNFALKPR